MKKLKGSASSSIAAPYFETPAPLLGNSYELQKRILATAEQVVGYLQDIQTPTLPQLTGGGYATTPVRKESGQFYWHFCLRPRCLNLDPPSTSGGSKHLLPDILHPKLSTSQ